MIEEQESRACRMCDEAVYDEVVTVHFTTIWGGLQGQASQQFGGGKDPPKLKRRSCKNSQNANLNVNKGEAAAEGRRPPLFSLLMAFWAFLHERRNNPPLNYCDAWPCRPPRIIVKCTVTLLPISRATYFHP